MKSKDNKIHWTDWANEYGTSLRATTKGATLKEMELCFLERLIKDYCETQKAKILEPGCGNGYNLISLAQRFPDYVFEGFDFVKKMVAHARENKEAKEAEIHQNLPIDFYLMDVRKFRDAEKMYDVIFTDRLLINLSSLKEQLHTIKTLLDKVKHNGVLILVENCKGSYERQNKLRKYLNLEPRKAAEFNVFLDEDAVIDFINRRNYKLKTMLNLGSIHDIILYVLLVKLEGVVCYSHPLVQMTKDLEVESFLETGKSLFGAFGQVNIFVIKK
jgi:SAM-dependent methyltransferase